ncbi:hypothetical protein D9M71_175350 [compost metagenome]
MHVGVAQVEPAFGAVETGEGSQRGLVIGSLVGGAAFPVRFLEQLRRLWITPLLEGPATLLVAGQEGIGQRAGIGVLGGHGLQEQAEQQRRQPVHAPAAAHGEEGQRQQRPAQPVAGVLPVDFRLFALAGLEVPLGVQFDPVEVVVVQRQAAQRRIGGVGQLLQAVGIEAAEHRLAAGIQARLATAVAQHAAVLIADGEDQHLQVTAFQRLLDRIQLCGVSAVGGQHQGAGRVFGGEQALGLFDGGQGVLAGARDHVAAQHLQEAVEQRRVVGGWEHQMGAAGVGEQGDAAALATLDQLVELVARRFQAARRHVGGIHRRRQVEGEDQRRAVVEECRAVLLPGRPGGGHGAEGEQRGEQVHRAHARAVLRLHQQVTQQRRSDGGVARGVLHASPEGRQGDGEQNQQQPGRSQEVEGSEIDLHQASSTWRMRSRTMSRLNR